LDGGEFCLLICIYVFGETLGINRHIIIEQHQHITAGHAEGAIDGVGFARTLLHQYYQLLRSRYRNFFAKQIACFIRGTIIDNNDFNGCKWRRDGNRKAIQQLL